MPRLPQIARPKLSADWRTVLRHAWTIRLMAVVFVLSILEVFLSLVALPIPPLASAVITGLVSAGAFWARLVAQKDISGEKDE